MALKQTENRVELEGYLNSKDITISSDKNQARAILEIRIDETNIVEVEFFAFKKTSKGADNKIYEKIVKIKDEYVASDSVESYKDADKINIVAELVSNDYKSKRTNEVVTIQRYRGVFINRVEEDKFNPRATFSVTGFVDKIVDEKKEGEETGNGFVNLFLVNYKKELHVGKFKVYGEDTWDIIKDNFHNNDLVKLHGDVFNKVETTVTEKPSLFGEPEKIVRNKTTRERVVLGGNVVELEDVDEDALEEAIKSRQKKLEAIEKGSELTESKQEKPVKNANKETETKEEDIFEENQESLF